jgi:hypothetical protein
LLGSLFNLAHLCHLCRRHDEAFLQELAVVAVVLDLVGVLNQRKAFKKKKEEKKKKYKSNLRLCYFMRSRIKMNDNLESESNFHTNFTSEPET